MVGFAVFANASHRTANANAQNGFAILGCPPAFRLRTITIEKNGLFLQYKSCTQFDSYIENFSNFAVRVNYQKSKKY